MNSNSSFILVALNLIFTSPLLLCAGQEKDAEQDQSLKDVFLREAPLGWQEYSQEVRRLLEVGRLQGSWSMKMSSNPEKIRMEGIYKLMMNGENRLIFHSRKRAMGATNENPIDEVVGLNLNYGFKLKRKNESSPWIISDLLRKGSRDLKLEFENRYKEMLDIAHSPLNYLVKLNRDLLVEVIKQPGFRVLKTRMISEKERKFAEITFEYSHEPEKLVETGTMLLDPQRFWCVNSNNVRRNGLDWHGTTRYEVLELNIVDKLVPVPKRAILRVQNDFEKEQKMDQEWHFQSDLDVPASLPDEREFTLSAFGLAEPASMARTEGANAPVYMVRAGGDYFPRLGGWLPLAQKANGQEGLIT